MEEYRFSLATLWHWYQPPWQEEYWVRRIAEECYLPVSRWLRDHPEFKVTVNITHSLIRHIQRFRLDDIIDNLGVAAEQGSVDFTGSAAYHAVLPTLFKHHYGRDEVRRQIELNDRYNRSTFGQLWQPRGFFPPEMAFSQELAAAVREMGYEWSITDAVCFDACNEGSIPHHDIGTVGGLPVFFRSEWSNEFSLHRPGRGDYDTAGYVIEMDGAARSWFGDAPGYLVVSHDVETFGHHIPQYDTSSLDAYLSACDDVCIEPVHFSSLVDELPSRDVKIAPGSWSTSLEDIANGEHFPLWEHTGNPVHAVLKEMTACTIEAVHGVKDFDDSNYIVARQLLDQGLSSCKDWWANSPGIWNPRNIYAGFDLLAKAAGYACAVLEKGDVVGQRIGRLRARLDEVVAKLS